MHQCCPPGLTTNQHPGGGVGGKRDARWTTNSPPLNPQSTPNPPPIHPQSTPNSPPRGDLVVDWWWIGGALSGSESVWWFTFRECGVHFFMLTSFGGLFPERWTTNSPPLNPQSNRVSHHRGTLSRVAGCPKNRVSPTGELCDDPWPAPGAKSHPQANPVPTHKPPNDPSPTHTAPPPTLANRPKHRLSPT